MYSRIFFGSILGHLTSRSFYEYHDWSRFLSAFTRPISWYNTRGRHGTWSCTGLGRRVIISEIREIIPKFQVMLLPTSILYPSSWIRILLAHIYSAVDF